MLVYGSLLYLVKVEPLTKHGNYKIMAKMVLIDVAIS